MPTGSRGICQSYDKIFHDEFMIKQSVFRILPAGSFC